MRSGIYAIRNLVNGKMYIGSSSDFDRRRATHLSALRSSKHHSPILQNAWTKYGECNFVFEMMEDIEPTYQALRIREQYYLDTLKPEYNVSDIADGHFRLGKRNSPEHCSKISATNMGRPGTNKGKKFSDEHRRRISEANMGKARRPVGYHHTPESIEKMRAKALIRTPRAQSPEEKAKRAIQMKVYWETMSPERLAEIRKTMSERHNINSHLPLLPCMLIG